MPLVSVLMPAYNTAQFIGDAIQSILSQTFSDFELIIVNDGSTDRTEDVVLSYQDNRIRYFKNDGNKGLTYTRNRLISLSSGEYIAFIDSDDLNNVRRLELQIRMLENDKSLGFVSASATTLNNDKTRGGSWKFDLTPEQLKPYFLFNNPVVTSTMTIRKSALPDVNFREGYPPCEDYDLSVRINYHHKGLVLPVSLASYRLHVNNISFLKNDTVRENINKVVSDQLRYYFNNEYSIQEEKLHVSLSDFSIHNNIADLKSLPDWLMKIRHLNSQYTIFEPNALDNVLYERVLKKFLRLSSYNLSVIKMLWEIKKHLNPTLSVTGRVKELVIFISSVLHIKIVN